MFALVTTSRNKKDGTYFINTEYLEYIKDAKLTPLLVTPETDLDGLTPLLGDSILFLTGGADISPFSFKEESYGAYNPDYKRDLLEISLLQKFYGSRLPVFGICRGFQIMFKFLEERRKVNDFLVFSQDFPGHNQGDHSISGENPTHRIFYRNGMDFVNSFHHQGVVVNTGLTNEAIFKEYDDFTPICYGIVSSKQLNLEAFRFRNWLAVQWHPERLINDYTLTNFVKECL